MACFVKICVFLALIKDDLLIYMLLHQCLMMPLCLSTAGLQVPLP